MVPASGDQRGKPLSAKITRIAASAAIFHIFASLLLLSYVSVDDNLLEGNDLLRGQPISLTTLDDIISFDHLKHPGSSYHWLPRGVTKLTCLDHPWLRYFCPKEMTGSLRETILGFRRVLNRPVTWPKWLEINVSGWPKHGY